MNKHLRFIALVYLLLQLSGCTYYIVSFEDVSNEIPHTNVVNLTFETKSELIIYGYNTDSNPDKRIHEYSIVPPPGVKNRFVLSQNRMPVGALMTAIAVKRCKDCFLDFEPRIKIEVSSNQLKQNYTLPIYIDAPLLVNDWGKSEGGIKFNTEYLEPASHP